MRDGLQKGTSKRLGALDMLIIIILVMFSQMKMDQILL